jgi:hypothetical protein
VKTKYFLLVCGGILALFGAVLVFALKDPTDSIGSIEVQPLGGVLLAAGVLLMGTVAIALMGDGGSGSRNGSGPDYNSIKAIGGLIVVVVGIGSVALLAVITLTRFDNAENDSAIAIASSAFGVISAVVGAYLGIKITAETTQKVHEKASEETEKAAIAEHEAGVKEKKISAVNETMEKLVSEDKVSKEQANAITEASVTAEEEARTPGPPKGAGST